MCNLFKPDRCHHCSACEKCILNMDHHCPWVNNCIGFNNRKYFLLLLVYTLTMTYFYWISSAIPMYNNLLWLVDYFMNYHWGDHFKFWSVFGTILNIILYIAVFVLSFLITCFSKFHFKLLFENKTTIENLEKKKKPYHSEWDLGMKKNFYQVFGRNCLYWPFPVMFEGGRPDGNGIEWEKLGDSFVSTSSVESGSQ